MNKIKLKINNFLPIIGPLIFLIIWSVLSNFNFIDPLFLPSPSKVANSFFELFIVKSNIYTSLYSSLVRMSIGFFGGILTGIPLGILIGSSKRLFKSVEFLIDFLRSIPSTSFLPLFMLLLGVGDGPKIAIVIVGCFFVCLINTASGVINSSPARVLVTRIMKASRTYIFFKVRLMEALPSISAGIKVSISYAIILVVVSEMFVGTDKGIGRLIYDAHYSFNMPEMYAMIIVTGLIGFLANKLYSFFERRFLHWSGK